MRALLPLGLCVVLASVSASGCAKKEEAKGSGSSSTIGSNSGEAGPRAEVPSRPADSFKSEKRTAPSPEPVAKPSTDRAGADKSGERRLDEPASREAKG